jgi:hypothetical protein
MMYKKKTFEILTVTGEKIEVSGMVSGAYAYHKIDREYIPTYLPTGNALPIPAPLRNSCKTPAKAKQVILTYRDFFGDNIPLKAGSFNGYPLQVLDCTVEKERQLKEKLAELWK